MSETYGDGANALNSPPAAATATAPLLRKSWWDQVPLAVAVALIGAMFAAGGNFTGRTQATMDKAIELNAIVQQISEDIKGQKSEAKETRAFQQQILLKVNDVYTRSEAQRDRDESMRRFSELTSQITILNGRLDRTDNTIRMMQDQMKLMQDMIQNRNSNSQRH